MWIGFEQDLDRIWMGSFRNMIEHWIEHYRLHVISCTYHIHITALPITCHIMYISYTYYILHITSWLGHNRLHVILYISHVLHITSWLEHQIEECKERRDLSGNRASQTGHRPSQMGRRKHHRWDAGSITDCTSCHIHITYYYMQYGTTQISLSILHTTQCSTAPWRDKLGALSNAANPSGVC